MKQDELESTLRESMTAAGVPADAITKTLKEFRAALKAEKDARPPKDKSKNQFVVLLDDPEGKLKGQSFLGHVMQIENDAPQIVALDRAKAAGRAFNESRKGRKNPVKNLRETFLSVPAKFWKDGVEGHKTLRKTKELILIQPTDGKLEATVS